ncbi:Xaa-Pro dipeptidyl-peptidase [Actinokineospora fastidiosa]|uniref:Xaa-Pro dipeptidyl-peptidase n=1 Tax=Actinokineospora fastidiosa TaxID=1816 RepID=A0A918GQK8_9PSEU|nr:Xaa-Pro dipeptidyl-peptidase [Actinokineospora fastidiosa]GGS50999.1 Xaa-Pro dipeptidyl-peptidase [Actinokineospora fastidiosa]
MRRARSAVIAALVCLPLVPATAHADPPAPVFVDGQAQPVFSPTDVVRESLWVTAPVDSDRNGHDDKVYVEVVRPRATEAGMKVPVVYQASPYYSGGNDVPNHNVDVELYVPGKPRPHAGRGEIVSAVGPSPAITWRYEQYFTARGFAVVYAESLGTGKSTGCPTTGGRNETIGARSVVDWLNGRAEGADASGAAVSAEWSTGKVGMMGVSYNGTLPNAVASTGVEGLETIVPIAAISNWYDYYRSDGAVVAAGGFQGEDADVLAEYVYTREDRDVCRPVIEELLAEQDRVTGDYSHFWDERNYLNDVHKVEASVLAVHGLNDWNVKTRQVVQWYELLKRHGVEHRIWLHQFGHSDPYNVNRDAWLVLLNRWMSHYLYDVDNGVERENKSTIQREDRTWAEEAEWPAPGTRPVTVHPTAGGDTTGGLAVRRGKGRETVVDDATKRAEDLAAAATSPHRLSYATGALATDLRISGTVRADLRLSFSRPAANVTALLVDRAPDGSVKVVTRGWADPQNRHSEWRTSPVKPGHAYNIRVNFMPDDYVFRAGHSLGVVVLSSDHDYTLRPRPGAEFTVDLGRSAVTLPVVGGRSALHDALG